MPRHSPFLLFQVLRLTGYHLPVSSTCRPVPQSCGASWFLDGCGCSSDHLCAPLPILDTFDLRAWQHATLSADEHTYIKHSDFTAPLGHGTAHEMPRHSPFLLFQVLLLTGYHLPVSSTCRPVPQSCGASWFLDGCGCSSDHLCAPLPVLDTFDLRAWQHATLSADEHTYIKHSDFTAPLGHGTVHEMPRHSPFLLFQVLLLTGYHLPVSSTCRPVPQSCGASWFLDGCGCSSDHLCAPLPILDTFDLRAWQHATLSADEHTYIKHSDFTAPLGHGTVHEMPRHSPFLLFQVLLLTGYHLPVSSTCRPVPQSCGASWFLDGCGCSSDHLCAPLPILDTFDLRAWQHATLSADEDTYIKHSDFTAPLGHGTVHEMPRHSPFLLFQVLLLTGYHLPVSSTCRPVPQSCGASWFLDGCGCSSDHLCAPLPILDTFDLRAWQHATLSADEHTYIKHSDFTAPLGHGTVHEMPRHSPFLLFQVLLLTGYHLPVSSTCRPVPQSCGASWFLDGCGCSSDHLCAPLPVLDTFDLRAWQHATLSADEHTYIKHSDFTARLGHGTVHEMPRHSPFLLFQVLLLTGYHLPVSSTCRPVPQSCGASWFLDGCGCSSDHLCAPLPILDTFDLRAWQHATLSADEHTYIKHSDFTARLGHGTVHEMPRHSPFLLFQVLLLTGYHLPVSSTCRPVPQSCGASWFLDGCGCSSDHLCAPLPILDTFDLRAWQHATLSADEDTYIKHSDFTAPLGHGTVHEMPRHSPFLLFQA
ncbi:hypothetical protein V5799_023587 [Amblyomma americanum]|uniref:Uncharacterized protein n=1 Tax=Amblyomma americanum TaxID=6943 RepID=A0AAQ4FH50_AMBAM